MLRQPYRLLICTLMLLATGSLRAQNLPATTKPTTPVIKSKVPYALDPVPEIAKLKPAPNVPSNPDDLKIIQARVEAVTKYAFPAIVNIQVADGQGSGVIVSKDGYVLTAGHVSGKPNQEITFILANGTRVLGKTLGANDQIDAGMCKITTPGEYAFMPLGSVAKMKVGQWVMAMGHPSGYEPGRSPVVRLGKVLSITTKNDPAWFIQTDCPLIMGDSGGPVFDLDGRVVGINSRIGIKATSNVHVPVDTFVETWERLAKGEQWGGGGGILTRLGGNPGVTPPPTKAALGLRAGDDKVGVMVLEVFPDKASERAGVQPQDIITRVNGAIVKTKDDLETRMSTLAPGETITLDILRNMRPLQVKVVLEAKDSK